MGRYIWRHMQIPFQDGKNYDLLNIQRLLKKFLRHYGINVPDNSFQSVTSPHDIATVCETGKINPKLLDFARRCFSQFAMDEDRLKQICRSPGTVFLMTLSTVDVGWDDEFKKTNLNLKVFSPS